MNERINIEFHMLKNVVLNLLKIGIAAGLIYWLVTSGKLDFKLLASLKNYPGSVLMAILLSIANFILVSFRWEIILRARSQVQLPISGLFRVTWIGQFFSAVLPGSVSGDLVRIIYVEKLDQSFTKKFVIASILIDRLMGLSGLIMVVGFSSLIFGKKIIENAPGMQPLINLNYLLTALVILSLATFYFLNGAIRKILVSLSQLALKSMFDKVIALWDDLVSIKKKLIKAALYSIGVQFIAVVIFWSLIYPHVGDHMNFVQAMAFIPIGLMSLALPVAPSGLGVGHAIFQGLFEMSGISNGASLFNLYFIVTLIVNIFGVIPYLSTRMNQAETKKIS
jgi:uncharacterized protein (TIRG00374 family)